MCVGRGALDGDDDDGVSTEMASLFCRYGDVGDSGGDLSDSGCGERVALELASLLLLLLLFLLLLLLSVVAVSRSGIGLVRHAAAL